MLVYARIPTISSYEKYQKHRSTNVLDYHCFNCNVLCLLGDEIPRTNASKTGYFSSGSWHHRFFYSCSKRASLHCLGPVLLAASLSLFWTVNNSFCIFSFNLSYPRTFSYIVVYLQENDYPLFFYLILQCWQHIRFIS